MDGENKVEPGEGVENQGDAAQGAAGTEPKETTPKEPGDEGTKDKHGQPGINREKYQRDMKAKDDRIAELEAKLNENAKTEEGREKLQQEIADLKKEIADERINHKLEMEKCRNLKAAKALLDDYDGDVKKLKEAEPWLFEDEEKPSGTTGVKPNASKATAEEERINKALGLKTKKE